MGGGFPILRDIIYGRSLNWSKNNFNNFVYVQQKEQDVLDFYKSRINFFYGANAEKINFDDFNSEVGDRINRMIETETSGNVNNFIQENEFIVEKPMVAFAANYFKVLKWFYLTISI